LDKFSGRIKKKKRIPPGGFDSISCNISTRRVCGVSWIGAAAGVGTGGGSGCGWYAEIAGSRLRWKEISFLEKK
jgi:hypothetical protein